MQVQIHRLTLVRNSKLEGAQRLHMSAKYSPQILVHILPARLQVHILHVAAAAMVQRNGHFACYTCYIFVHFS